MEGAQIHRYARTWRLTTARKTRVGSNQTGQILNIAAAGEAAGLNKRTADNYTKLLEALFLVQRLPAWGTTLRARAAALPKLHLVDSGLAARLLRLTQERLAQANATALQQFGHLLETFVVGEIRAQASWMDGIPGSAIGAHTTAPRWTW